MIEIETENYRSPIYCIMCNTKTTDNTGTVTPCPHLVYLGMGEGTEFSIYKSVEEPEGDDDWDQYDTQLDEFRKKLGDEHLCIHIATPAPSGETYSIIYNLNADLKDTKNQQKKECPYWTVWGSTLEKYGITEEDV
jgi:hypothetical protein